VTLYECQSKLDAMRTEVVALTVLREKDRPKTQAQVSVPPGSFLRRHEDTIVLFTGVLLLLIMLMNILDLAKQTKELAAKATPGPWGSYPDGDHPVIQYGGIRDFGGIHIACEKGSISLESDLDFIAHSRTAAPQLADAVIQMVEALQFYAAQGEAMACGACIEDGGDQALALLTKLGIEVKP
jgi:hypothetical protein